MKTIYLSGPITGRNPIEMKNHFFEVAISLRRQAAKLTDEKVEVYDPSDISDANLAHDTYMKIARDVLHDPKISAICLMKGWERSRGCMMELMWAKAQGMPIIYEAGAMRA